MKSALPLIMCYCFYKSQYPVYRMYFLYYSDFNGLKLYKYQVYFFLGGEVYPHSSVARYWPWFCAYLLLMVRLERSYEVLLKGPDSTACKVLTLHTDDLVES